MLQTYVRYAVFGFGCLFLLGGLLTLAIGGPAVLVGLWTALIGSVAVVASVMQRDRYRSEKAELTSEQAGPGGGEHGPIEPRFLPTMEVFVDPTSNRRMRVFVDPRSGERRYRAEG